MLLKIRKVVPLVVAKGGTKNITLTHVVFVEIKNSNDFGKKNKLDNGDI